MKIAFFLSDYPVFTETFIINEIFLLQKSKIDGKIWYEIERSEKQQPLVKKINYKTQKITSKIKANFTDIVKSHLYWLINHPLRYIFTIFLLPIKIGWIDIRSIIKAPLTAIQVKNFNPDLIYNHDSDNAYYHALLCSKLNKKPLTIIFHTYHLFHKSKHLKTKIKNSTLSIFQSEYSKNYALNKFKNLKNKNKLKVVSSVGINTKFFKNKNNSFKNKTLKIVVVCRLEKSKGLDSLIKSISILKKQKVPINCKIIGDGTQKEKLIKLKNSLKLDKEVKLLGKIPHNKKLIKYLSEAEAFVLPSLITKSGDRDMQPNAVKEAMSMELLTITSNLGGIEEVITDNKDGFILNNNSPQHIADKIKMVWQMPEEVKKDISKKARQKIKNKYEAGLINNQLINTFKNL
jgi:colanic acid/amylovoran biosynthesis glycosyltransferase